MYQTTLNDKIIFEGRGLHSGKYSKIILAPSCPGSGIVFSSLYGDYKCKVTPFNVNMTYLSTSININEQFRVLTIEHIMAALLGVGIDNVVIYIDGPEVPSFDGSAAIFVEAIKKVGIRVYPVKRRYLKIKKKISIHNGDKWIEIIPSRFFKITFRIKFNDTFIDEQEAYFKITPEVFEQEISKARTFAFKRDILFLRGKGLALGGSLKNTIVVDNENIVNKNGLRYVNEFVRHKILDLIGDISLINYRILGHIRAYKSGHSLNNLLAKAILSDGSNYELTEINSSERIIPYNYNSSIINPQLF
jgi:UDP-3-O-[3-hydroxymyristoyl] N-acetylglucosamine deacetylase